MKPLHLELLARLQLSQRQLKKLLLRQIFLH